MVIFDTSGNVIENPNLELGYIEDKSIPITHTYIVDMPEVSHIEVIREYPETGGKDVETVIDQEEQGHYETRDESGKLLEHYDGKVPEGFPKEEPIHDYWNYQVYIPYTPEELAEQEEARREQEEALEKYNAQQQWLEEAPAMIEDIDAAICELYEGLMIVAEANNG